MKKIYVSLLIAALVLGAGTAVFAAGNNNSGDSPSFEIMLPFMEKMHPGSSKEDLQNMYRACHENGGMMNGPNDMNIERENMMNSF